MSLLKRMPRGLYSTHDVITGTDGFIPFPPDCTSTTWIEGYKQVGSIGSLTKSTYRGVTITELVTEVSFSEVFGECWVNSATMYLSLASNVKVSKIVVFTTGSTYTYNAPVSNFGSTNWNVVVGSGGTATWDSPIGMLIYY
jgi:hypothetical protein